LSSGANPERAPSGVVAKRAFQEHVEVFIGMRRVSELMEKNISFPEEMSIEVEREALEWSG